MKNHFLFRIEIWLAINFSNVKNGAGDNSIIVIVFEGVFPDVLDLSFLGFITDINLADFPLSQFNTTFHVALKVLEILRSKTQYSPYDVMFIILMLINANNSIINAGDFEILFKLKLEHFKLGIKFM